MTAQGRSAIVIGAGLAGLAAAYRLQQAGFRVEVLEKRDRVGGRVLTLRRDGYTIDAGPDAMTEGYRHYRALAEALGLGNAFVASSPVIGLLRGGRVIDIDTGSMTKMLFTPALSWRAKFGFALALLRQRQLFVGVDSFRLTDAAAFDSDTENAEAFSLRVFGREITQYVSDPLVRLVVGSGAAQSSRLGLLGGLVNWSVALMNIEGGLDTLPRALAQRLQVRTNVEAEAVTETANGVAVVWRNADGTRHAAQADVCVIAATYDAAERIHPPLRKLVPGYGERLRYLSLVSVSLAYAAPTRSKAYVVQVPTVENADALLIFLQHNKAPDRAPPGHSLITVYTDGMATPRYLKMSEEDIATWARQEIEKLFPELRGSYQFASVSKWPLAGYLATPGFWRRTRALLDTMPAQGRVQLAGDLFGAGSMESAVTWGEHAARLLIEYHGKATRS